MEAQLMTPLTLTACCPIITGNCEKSYPSMSVIAALKLAFGATDTGTTFAEGNLPIR